jgi:hypothetical protein
VEELVGDLCVHALLRELEAGELGVDIVAGHVRDVVEVDPGSSQLSEPLIKDSADTGWISTSNGRWDQLFPPRDARPSKICTTLPNSPPSGVPVDGMVLGLCDELFRVDVTSESHSEGGVRL